MKIKLNNKQTTTILSILVFSLAIMLSGNAFAAKPDGNTGGNKEDMATQAELDAAIIAEDTALRLEITNATTTLQTLITAQQTALDEALADIADLQAIHNSPAIGESRGGGVVFYVDETERSGLIASFANQSEGIQWYNGDYLVTGATGDGVGAGASNATKIMAVQGAGAYAAKIAEDYSVQEDGLTAWNS